MKMFRVMEYVIVALVAIVFSIGMIVMWEYLRGLYWPGSGSLDPNEAPVIRQEIAEKCDQQFRGRTPAATAPARYWDEYNLRYTPDRRAFVLVRARGNYYSSAGYSSDSNYSSPFGSSSSSSSSGPPRILPGVGLHVVHPENPYRNSATCSEDFAYNAKDNTYEAWCSWRPDSERPERNDFRIFVTNDTDGDVEYCMVTNCAAEAWQGGNACPQP